METAKKHIQTPVATVAGEATPQRPDSTTPADVIVKGLSMMDGVVSLLYDSLVFFSML